MEALLRDIKGKFILSLNDRPEVREVFGKFQIHSVDLAYTAKRDATVRHSELLITNYEVNEKVSVKS